jgi:hypothetical protein
VNEEELAGLLDEYLDKFLGGESTPGNVPAELTDLLSVAQELTAVAPMPRPEFTAVLRASVLASAVGAAGSVSAVTTALSSKLTFLIVAGVTVLAAIALTIGALVSRESQSVQQPVPSPTLIPAATETTEPTHTAEPEPPTSTLAPTATATEITPTPEPTATSTETATPIIDEIPTVIVIDEVEPAIDLLPPEPTSTSTSTSTPMPIIDSSGDTGDNPADNDSGGQEEGTGNEGDHDRGHGNDDDRNDEDNPGKGGKKK